MVSPQGETAQAQHAEPADDLLQAEQIRLLFRFSLVGHLATLLVIFILGAILWEDLARPALFIWFFSISLVAVGRYLLYKAFIAHAPGPNEMRVWEGRFIAGTILAGVCWPMIGSILLPESTRMVQRLSVVMLVMLLMTGAVAYYAPHRYAYKIMAFLGLAPPAVTLGISGDRTQMSLWGSVRLVPRGPAVAVR